MDELFGPISATTIAAICTVLVQIAKEQWQLDGKIALVVSLIISLFFFLPFYLIFFWGTIPPAQLIYSSMFYSFCGWLLSCGFYSTVKTGLGR